MSFWLSLLGYQAVWLAAVIGAGHGTAWPGVLGMLVYAVAQLLLARNVRVNLSLMAAGLVLGFLFDGALLRCGLASYASGWPDLQLAPAWILALWISFALTFSQSLRHLQNHLWLAALLGLLGGPLAYLGAARGWQVVSFAFLPPFHYQPDLFWDAKDTAKDRMLAPGPNGPVGVAWLDLSKEHYGIHGTPEPSTIGKTESHGCIRMTNWDVMRLARIMAKPGFPAIFQQ